MMRTTGILAAVVIAAGVSMTGAAATAADHTSGDETTHLGPGNSYQRVVWNRSTRKVKMVVKAGSMSDDHCLEALFDWRVDDGSHYDIRVLRNCDPGSKTMTDPDNDGFWQEPSNWDSDTHDSPVDGVRVVAARLTTDSDLSTIDNVTIFGSGSYYGGRNPPGPGNEGWAAVRTRYQGGSVDSNRNEVAPERCWREDRVLRNDCAGPS